MGVIMGRAMRVFAFFAFFNLLILPAPSLAEERLTITTYYPSPSGSYRDLYVSEKLGVGTTSAQVSPSALRTTQMRRN